MDHYPRQGEEKFLGTNLSLAMSAAVLKSSFVLCLHCARCTCTDELLPFVRAGTLVDRQDWASVG